MLKTSSSIDLLTSLTKIIIEYDGVDIGASCNRDSDRKFAF